VSSENAPDFDRTGASTSIDRRGNVRATTHAVFTVRMGEAQLMGGGQNLSRSGAYFVTSDEIPIEICFVANGKETQTGGKIVRIDTVSPGTYGIAIEFGQRLPESKLLG
jgi:PilZ domain-containing protein